MTPRLVLAASIVAALCVCDAPAQAQTYPDRTVRLIIPFPAGGATDVIGRLVTDRLSSAVEAAGRGRERRRRCRRARHRAGRQGRARRLHAHDGHRHHHDAAAAPAQQSARSIRMRDFEAVSLLCTFPNILVVRPEIPAKDVKELIALARANPGKYSYASSGYGGSPHLAAEWFKLMTKTDILHVPFTGSAPALPALLGGHVDMMFDTMPSIWPQVQSGKLRALGVTTAERIPFVPDVPSIAETLPGYDVSSWLGILLPTGTPAEIKSKISADLQQIVHDKVIQQKFQDLGAIAKGTTAAEFAAFMRKDYDKWGGVIRETGIKLNN